MYARTQTKIREISSDCLAFGLEDFPLAFSLGFGRGLRLFLRQVARLTLLVGCHITVVVHLQHVLGEAEYLRIHSA